MINIPGGLRYLWAGPATLVGLGFAVLGRATGGRVRRVDGVVEAHGGAVTWLLRRAVPLQNGALALTLGHVVLGRDAATLDRTRRHERVHVAQFERWGFFFFPAYGLATLAAWARGQRPYRDNAFERAAYDAERLPPSAPDRATPPPFPTA